MASQIKSILIGIILLLVILQLSHWLAFWLPLPVPLIGLAGLLAVFFLLRRVPEGVQRIANLLLRHLSLLFTPAVIGVGLYWSQIHPFLTALGLTLLISTPISLFVTAALARYQQGSHLD